MNEQVARILGKKNWKAVDNVNTNISLKTPSTKILGKIKNISGKFKSRLAKEKVLLKNKLPKMNKPKKFDLGKKY
jgi:hypothetical protein